MTKIATGGPLPGRQSNRIAEKDPDLKMVNPAAAVIDIGSTMHMAAVHPDACDTPVRAFGTFTQDLHDLADWFKACGVTSVAMESTGVYWIPAFEVLEARGFHVILVNARYAKNVPGGKTDVSDAGWLRQLHSYGLLRGSFRPAAEIATLRAYLRQRERLVEYAAAHFQHMQKALMEMNLQLHHVVSDITGSTGMRIIRAIVAGERDPEVLAAFRDIRCHSTIEVIKAALVGNDRDEHIFALAQSLDLYDFYQSKIEDCDRKLESAVAALTIRVDGDIPALPKARTKRKQVNAASFDVRAALYGVLGTDLTQIHALGPSLALKLVAECGTDLRAWKSAKHVTSWLCLAPGNKISGGKLLSSRTRRFSSRAAALLRLAATTIGRSDTALGAFYRRLSSRIGKQKAVTATARKIAVLVYNALRFGMTYHDPGAAAYEERHRTRVLANLQRRAKTFGFELAPIPAPEAVSLEGDRILRQGIPVRYAFIAENRLIFAVRAMCRMLLVHSSGFYAWLREPLSQRALEDKRQTVLLKRAWDDSGEVYGYRKLHDDLCDLDPESWVRRRYT